MEQIRKFLRDKGFALALLACLVAAAAAGVWAVRTVRDELDKNLSGLKTPDSTSTAPGIDEGLSTTTPQEDETTWEWPTEPAANSVSNVPKAASSASRSASSASSAPQAGSGSVREPSALQGASSPASSSAAPASTQPVSGRVLNGYSGDELVYNKTLGDWRTHNGIDYACAKGCCRPKPHGGHGGAGRFRWQLGPHCGDQGQCGPCLAALRRGQPGGEGGRDGQCRADIGQSGQRQL